MLVKLDYRLDSFDPVILLKAMGFTARDLHT